jgi:hypothetical protein
MPDLSLFGMARGGRKKRHLKRDIYGVNPDFTSKMLGLEPMEVSSVKDAIKQMKKLDSGLGLRTGLRIKKGKIWD